VRYKYRVVSLLLTCSCLTWLSSSSRVTFSFSLACCFPVFLCTHSFYGNVLVVVTTVIGFGLAVATTSMQQDEHFTDETHQKVGLAIFVIVLFQALVGYFRPAAPKTASSAGRKAGSGNNGVDHSNTRADDSDFEEGFDLAEAPRNQSQATSLPTTTSAKSKLRIAWEVLHRLAGVTLLGSAWYNCTSGYRLMGEDFSESDDKTNIFVSAPFSALFFVRSKAHLWVLYLSSPHTYATSFLCVINSGALRVQLAV